MESTTNLDGCYGKESCELGPDSGFLSGAISTEEQSSSNNLESAADFKSESDPKLQNFSRLDSGLDLTTSTTGEDISGDSVLHSAILQSTKVKNYSAVQQTIKSSPELVNEINRRSQSPLHYSCMIGDYSIARLLIQSGAIPSLQDDHGNTPLHYGVQTSEVELIKELIAAMETPDVYNYDGLTPLHLYVVSMGADSSILQLLLDYCSPNLTELKSGQSPLHLAIQYNNSPLLKVLIRATNLTTANYEELNPYEYAVETGNSPVAREILKQGGGGWVRTEEDSDDDDDDRQHQPTPPTISRTPVTCS